MKFRGNFPPGPEGPEKTLQFIAELATIVKHSLAQSMVASACVETRAPTHLSAGCSGCAGARLLQRARKC